MNHSISDQGLGIVSKDNRQEGLQGVVEESATGMVTAAPGAGILMFTRATVAVLTTPSLASMKSTVGQDICAKPIIKISAPGFAIPSAATGVLGQGDRYHDNAFRGNGHLLCNLSFCRLCKAVLRT